MLHERGLRLGRGPTPITSETAANSQPADAPQAGADLRAARERLGVDLPHAAEVLRIRLAHLEALEAGRLGALPSPAYALGYLRSYASALGLDPDEMTRRFRTEAVEVSETTRLDFPTPVPERGLPTGAIMLLGVVLLAGVYAGWYRLSGEGRLPAETVAPIPERLAPLAEQAIPPTLASRLVDRRPTLPADPLPVAEPFVPAPAISPSSAAAAPVAPIAPPRPVVAPPAADPQPDQPRVLIRATADAWIQVKDKAGTVLLNKVLKPGESWPVPNRPGLVFTTGNAGGTELVLDGVLLPGLGGGGAVRRDLALDPDLLKDGKPLTPAATRTP